MNHSSTKYAITTKVDFDPDSEGMAFEPPQSEFLNQFDKLLGDM